MNHKEFEKTIYNSPDELLPRGTDAQTCLNILAEHFLGHTRIDGYPASQNQWNSEVTYEILRKYQKENMPFLIFLFQLVFFFYQRLFQIKKIVEIHILQCTKNTKSLEGLQ